MAVTHPAAVRTVIADAVTDTIDDGPGAGTLEFQTSGAVEAATVTFSDPAFGAAAGPTATANAITSDTNATGGTTDRFVIKDSTGAAKGFAGSVGLTGEDINLSAVDIPPGATVGLTSLTYTAPV